LLHLWSLGVEEQFYLVWPLCLVLLAYKKMDIGKFIVGMFLFSFLLNILFITKYPAQVFYMLPTRFWELLVGCGLAYVQSRGVAELGSRKNIISFIGLALLIIAGFEIRPGDHVPGWWALLPVFAGLFIIWAGPTAPFNRIILASRPMVFIGMISYPLYLWHWPLLSMAQIVNQDKLPASYRLAILGISFVLATLTWLIIEYPIRFRVGIRSSRRASYAIICCSLLCLTLVGSLGILSNMRILKPATAAVLGDLKNYDQDMWRGDRCFLGSAANDASDFKPLCYTSNSKKTIFLWGDSFGAHLYPGLLNFFGDDKSVSILQVTTASCAPIIGHTESRIPACEEINNFALQKIKRTHPQVVILAGNWSEYFDWDRINDDLERTTNKLIEMGVRHVLIVGQSPVWKSPLPETLERNYIKYKIPIPRESKINLKASIFFIDNMMKSKHQRHGVTLISPIDTFCKSEECVVMLGNDTKADLFSLDEGHFTFKAAAFFISDRIGPLINSIFQKD